MVKGKAFLLAMVVVVGATLFVPTEVRASTLPDVCLAQKYRIDFLGVEPTVPADGSVEYVYDLTGSPAALKKVSRIVLVFTRPVAPADIIELFGQSVGNYCVADRATKINEGDCDSFTLDVTPEPTEGRIPFRVRTTIRTRGTITPNIITGTAGVDTCQGAVPNGNGGLVTLDRGIEGPGVEVDPDAAIAAISTFTAGVCTVLVAKDATGAIVSVTIANQPGTADDDCAVQNATGDPLSQVTISDAFLGFDLNLIFVPNDTIIGGAGSPACYWWFHSGRWYRICG